MKKDNITSISLLFGGDGHLNPILPNLKEKNGINFSYPWGNMFDYIRSMDGFIFNHEGTISDSPLIDIHPTRFQDPEGWTETFSMLGNAILSLGNNHQFDWGLEGLLNTTSNLNKAGVKYVGVGLSKDVRKPLIIDYKGIKIGYWAIVAQVCTPANDPPVRCTCRRWGEALPPQCLASNDTDPGLWLVDLQNTASVDTSLKDLKTSIFLNRKVIDFNIILTHGGPAFSWLPTDERSDFYQRIIDIGGDMVFGTGPAHVENTIIYKNKVIVFAPGQILFRHFPGVWGNCPPWAFPCQNYRPELAFLHQFNIEKNGKTTSLKSVELVPIRHNHVRMKKAPIWDSKWLMNVLNRMRSKMPYSARILYDKITQKYFLDIPK